MIALFHFLVEFLAFLDVSDDSGQVLKALEMARVKQRTDGGPAFTFPQRDQEVVAMCEMYLDRKGEFWNLWQKIAVIFLQFFLVGIFRQLMWWNITWFTGFHTCLVGGALFPFKFYWCWLFLIARRKRWNRRTKVPPEHPKHGFCFISFGPRAKKARSLYKNQICHQLVTLFQSHILLPCFIADFLSWNPLAGGAK